MQIGRDAEVCQHGAFAVRRDEDQTGAGAVGLRIRTGKADPAVFHVVRVMLAEGIVGDPSQVISFAAER